MSLSPHRNKQQNAYKYHQKRLSAECPYFYYQPHNPRTSLLVSVPPQEEPKRYGVCLAKSQVEPRKLMFSCRFLAFLGAVRSVLRTPNSNWAGISHKKPCMCLCVRRVHMLCVVLLAYVPNALMHPALRIVRSSNDE